jgi:RNA polymerase sigma-70 factor, ECF subfamily
LTRDPNTRVADFIRLTEPCHRMLYGFALTLCKDADQANDLTQEALIRAFEAFDQFRPGAPLMPWLRRILRNLFFDSFKTGRAQHEISEREMSLADAAPLLEAADDSKDPLVQLEGAQLAGWLKEEIEALEPGHQQVLQLCVMQDLSFEEAAEAANVPVGTIASRLARARAQLRERMLQRTTTARHPERKGAQARSMDEDEPLGRRSIGTPKRSLSGANEAGQGVAKEAKTPQ